MLKIIIPLLSQLVVIVSGAADEEPPRIFTSVRPDVKIDSEGNRSPLLCAADGRPEPMYSWYKDDKLFVANISDTYRIQPVNRTNAGVYRCIALNSAGAIRDVQFVLKISFLDSFNNVDSTLSMSANRGSAIILRLPSTLAAYPPPTATWSKNDRIISPSLWYYVTLNQELVILNLSVEQNGDNLYRASLKNTFDSVLTPRIALKVTEPSTLNAILIPEPIVRPTDVNYVYDSQTASFVMFECVFNARPLENLLITWFQQNADDQWRQIMTDSSSRFTIEVEFSRSLRIRSPTRQDAGLYRCAAKLLSGGGSPGSNVEVTLEARLTVLEKPVWERQDSTAMLLDRGSNATLICRARSQPWPVIKWFKNAQPLGSNDTQVSNTAKYQVLATGDLFVMNLQPQDMGMFQCFAVNEAGEINYAIWLRVQSTTPTIISKPTDTLKVEGDDVSLFCKASGAPAPQLIWFLANSLKPIVSSGRVQLINNGGTLLIAQTQPQDSARYICLAINLMGNASASADLTVLRRTRIIRPLQPSMEAVEGTVIDLLCGFQCDPIVTVLVQWFQIIDSIPVLVLRSHITVEQSSGTMRITGVRSSDVGLYRCVVNSTAGSDLVEGQLKIIQLPYKPILTAAVLSVADKRSVDLSWQAGFNGGTPILGFFIQTQLISSVDGVMGPWIAGDFTDSTARQYTVSQLLPSKTYRFRISAKNKVGEGEPSLPSDPLQIPEQAPSSAPVEVYASVSSNSSISVRWRPPDEKFQNGALLGYTVRYKISGYPDNYYIYTNVTPATVYFKQLQDLITFKEYEISVGAFNRMGVGVYSDSRKEMTAEGIPSLPPGDVTAIALSSTSIRVSWSAPRPDSVNGINQGYYLTAECLVPLLRCSNVTVSIPYDPLKINEQLITDLTNLKKFTNYGIKIVCFTKTGAGPANNPPFSIRTWEDVPGPVEKLEFVNIVDNSITVNWLAPTDINGVLLGYTLSYQIIDRNETLLTNQLAPTVLTFQLAQLVYHTWYVVSVAGRTRMGMGEIISARIQSGVPPELPGAPSQLSIVSIAARSLLLSFQPGFDGRTGINRWLVEAQIGGETSSWEQVFTIHAPLANQITVTGLTPNTLMRLRLLAENIKGTSPPSVPSNWLKTKEDKPDQSPQNLAIRVYSARQLNIRWTPLDTSQWNGNTGGYILDYRSRNENDWNSVEVSDANAFRYLLNNLQANTMYFIRMLAYNIVGKSSYTSLISESTFEAAPGNCPDNIQVNFVASNLVGVSWRSLTSNETNDVILGIWLYYWTEEQSNVNSIQVQGNNVTFPVLISSLYSYTNYSIQIAAYNRMGVGLRCPTQTPLTLRTSMAISSPPVGLYFPAVNTSWVLAAWSPPRYPNGVLLAYSIMWWSVHNSNSSSPISQQQEIVASTTLSFSSPYNLEKGASYRFEVRAKNALGWSLPISVLVALRTDRYLPKTILYVNLISSEIRSREITLSWTSNDDAFAPIRNYSVQLCSSYEDPYISMCVWRNPDDWDAWSIPPTNTTYTVKKLLPNTYYRFRISSSNDVGRSEFSEASTIGRTACELPADSPQKLHLVPQSLTSILASWDSLAADKWNGPAVAYRVRIGQLNQQFLVQQIAVDKTSVVLDQLKVGLYYEVSIAAVNSEGQGSWSEPPQIIYVGEATPSAAPSSFSCQAGNSETSVACQWKVPPNNTHNGQLLGYKIVYKRIGAGKAKRQIDSGAVRVIFVITQSRQNVNLSDLEPFSLYEISIVAFNSVGDGPSSIQIYVQTKQGRPSPVRALDFAEVSLDEVLVKWSLPQTPNGVITRYRINYRQVSEGTGKSVTDFTLDTSYRATGLNENIEYQFEISAQTVAGLWSEAISANVTTGPRRGSPPAPHSLQVLLDENSVRLIWEQRPSAASTPVIGALIQFLLKDTVKWQRLESTSTSDFTYRVDFQLLQPNSYYKFRVISRNSVGISFPSDPSTWVLTPHFIAAPFYTQWWFLVIVALCGLILIIITISILCVTGYRQRRRRIIREKKYNGQVTNVTFDNPIETNEGGDLGSRHYLGAVEMTSSNNTHNTGDHTGSSNHASTSLPRRNYLKHPPRPKPTSLSAGGVPSSSESDCDSKNPIPSSKGSICTTLTGKQNHDDFSDSDFHFSDDEDEFEFSQKNFSNASTFRSVRGPSGVKTGFNWSDVEQSYTASYVSKLRLQPSPLQDSSKQKNHGFDPYNMSHVKSNEYNVSNVYDTNLKIQPTNSRVTLETHSSFV